MSTIIELCSLSLIITVLYTRSHPVFIGGEAIRNKACPLHSTQGSIEFQGMGFAKPSVLIIIIILMRFMNSETANSCVFLMTHIPTNRTPTRNYMYMLRPDSQPLTRFEAGRPVSKRVSSCAPDSKRA